MEIKELKLYTFQPEGHGQASFFTMAESEEEARKAIDKYVADNYTTDGKLHYRADGWGTDYYQLTVTAVGEVVENDND